MSKEREFLKKLRYASLLENDLRKELEELLAQPEQEQEPVAWRTYRVVTDDWQYHIFPYGLDLTCQPLYLAPPPPTPPNRKPINTERITLEMFSEGIDINYKDGYVAGIKFAEKAHGITGVDDE